MNIHFVSIWKSLQYEHALVLSRDDTMYFPPYRDILYVVVMCGYSLLSHMTTCAKYRIQLANTKQVQTKILHSSFLRGLEAMHCGKCTLYFYLLLLLSVDKPNFFFPGDYRQKTMHKRSIHLYTIGHYTLQDIVALGLKKKKVCVALSLSSKFCWVGRLIFFFFSFTYFRNKETSLNKVDLG